MPTNPVALAASGGEPCQPAKPSQPGQPSKASLPQPVGPSLGAERLAQALAAHRAALATAEAEWAQGREGWGCER